MYSILKTTRLKKHSSAQAVVLHCSDGVLRLKSYDTIVAEYSPDENRFSLVPWNVGGRTSSPTTTRQITWWRRELGV